MASTNRNRFQPNYRQQVNQPMSSIMPTDPIQPEQDEVTTEVQAEPDVEQMTDEVVQPDESIEPTPEPAIEVVEEPVTKVSLFKAAIDKFLVTYPVNKIVPAKDRLIMLREIENIINRLADAETMAEITAMLSLLRTAFYENKSGALSASRILGIMRNPISGELLVQNNRTWNMLNLMYLTCDPAKFSAQKGRIDIKHEVVGFPENVALNIIHYFS